MDQLASKSFRPASPGGPEEILERYYDRMNDWAVGLTRGDIEKAEDIVHDLCLDLTLSKPDLSHVENLDAYLYTCLRHFYLSYLSRSSREALRSIATAEFDSIRVALWAHPDSDPLRLQNELRQIANYVIWRKAHTKAASYFILRFFHGYSLQEIADRSCVPLATIYDKLSKARSDVQGYLDEPKQIQLADHNGPPAPALLWAPVSSTDFFRELREQIMSARMDKCLPEKALLAHYLTQSPRPLSCALLSHIVSCEQCLATVDLHFQGSTFDGGKPAANLQPPVSEKSEKRGSRTRGQGRQAVLRAVREHRQYTYDHRPRKLSIAVDGKIVASHAVRARESELSARIERPESANFVEVFSDQGLRLAFFPIGEQPPTGQWEQARRIELSDGRWLKLVLTFDGMGLNSEVTYFDPTLASEILEKPSMERSSSDAALRNDAGRQASETEEDAHPETVVDNSNSDHRSRRWGRSVLRRLTAWWRCTALKWKEIPVPNMNPLLASALVLAITSFACFSFWIYQQPHISPSTLLNHARQWEAGTPGNVQPGVIYQKVRITTRKRSLERGIYRDAQGYRRLKRRQLSPEDEQLRYKLAAAGVNWDDPLSPATYQDWHDHQSIQSDRVTRTGKNLLTLTTSTDAPDSPVMRETLTVRESDFHPVDRTVELRDLGTVEIAELNYDVLPWNMANPDWFEQPAISDSVRLPHANVSPSFHLPLRLTDSQLDEAELEVRLALNRLGADQTGRIEVVRRPDGIQVKGIVETSERKHEIEANLHQLPYVISAIYTFQEFQNRAAANSEVSSVRQMDAVVGQAPLEKFLLDRGRSRDEVRRISGRMFSDAAAVTLDGTAMDDLIRRFDTGKPLTPDARATLNQLLVKHQAHLLAALSDEEAILADAGLVAGNRDQGNTGHTNMASLQSTAEDNVALCKELISIAAGQTRSTEAIAPDLVSSVHRLRSILLDLARTTQAAQKTQP